jgi:hypothetical protein
LEQDGAELALSWLGGEHKTFDLGGLLQLTVDCRRVWLEELPYWDGTRVEHVRVVYRSTNKRNIEIAQTVAASIGQQVLVRRQLTHGMGTQDVWIASFNARTDTRIEALERTEVAYDGTVYCPTVPTGFFLVRHRDRISVTGNTNYGLTEFGMVRNFSQTFPTITIARKFKRAYLDMCPKLHAWQKGVQELAYRQNFLGGPGAHPFDYKHWLWAVLSYRGITESAFVKRQVAHEPVTRIQGRPYAIVLGEDAKRAVAFFPQSTAAGVLKDAMLRLFDPDGPSYIGDAYFGRTPLRAPIHDSLFLEVPVRAWDRVLERVVLEMTRPVPELPLNWVSREDRVRFGFGDHLSIGVEAKTGDDWGSMQPIDTAGLVAGVIPETTAFALDDDAENQDDFAALRTVMGTEVVTA